MGFDTLSAVIRELAETYIVEHRLDGISAINNGYCGDFADELCSVFSDIEVVMCSTPTHLMLDGPRIGGHFWVRIDSRYYDAEAPDGVIDWRELPFFIRDRALGNGPKQFWELPMELLPDCREGN